MISGTGGARKVRIPLQGKGKSGGYRVITFYSGKDLPVFLLDRYAQSEKADLTRREINGIRTIVADILQQYLE